MPMNLSLTYTAHRALSDVEALERIIVKTPLVSLLSSLPCKSPEKQIGAWCAQKDLRSRSTRLLSSLGKKITATQAKRLDSLSLSYEALIELRASSKDGEDFTSALHKRGVNSKKLREKLTQLIPSKR